MRSGTGRRRRDEDEGLDLRGIEKAGRCPLIFYPLRSVGSSLSLAAAGVHPDLPVRPRAASVFGSSTRTPPGASVSEASYFKPYFLERFLKGKGRVGEGQFDASRATDSSRTIREVSFNC